MESQSGSVDSVPLPSCQVCGRQDETLRAVSYPFVISVIVVTFWRAFSGIWCKRHRRRYLFLSSLLSSSLGWWGIPFGIISTPVTLFKLARGGNINPLQNFQLLTVLAEHKLLAGDSQGAIRCFEESLKFQDSHEVHQKLSRLYQQYRPDAPNNIFRTLASFAAVPSLLLMATVIGLIIGIFDIFIIYLLTPLFGSTESIFVVFLSWLPLVLMIFLGILLVRSRTEWALKQIHCENKLLAYVLALSASTFAFYSILEGRAIIDSVPSMLTAYSFSANDVLFGARAILAYGGILELINFYQVQQAYGIIYILLFGASAVFSFYVGITTAFESAQWQTRLVEIRKSLAADSDGSSAFAWISLAGTIAIVILFGVILSPGRFVNIEKANLHFENGRLAMDGDDTEKALNELELAVAIWPEAVRGHASLGLVYIGQEKYDLALAEAETALSLDPKSVIAHFLMGFVQSFRLEFPAAMEHLKVVAASQPNWGLPHAYLALLYYQSDQTDLMQQEIQMALAHEEGDGQTSFLIGAYYMGIQNYTESEKHILKATQLPSATSEEYFLLARVYAAEEKFDLAKDAIDRASSLNAKEVDIHLARADLFMLQEDLASAISEITTALKSSPNNSEAHSNLSYVYFQQGRIDDAAEEAELAITANQYNTQAYIEQAFAYHAQGKLTAALSTAQKAVAFSPKYDRGHYILGLCYLDKGMKIEAINEFKVFLDLYWERAYAEQYKESAEKYLMQLQK